jgi:hypothetical protein
MFLWGSVPVARCLFAAVVIVSYEDCQDNRCQTYAPGLLGYFWGPQDVL